MLPLVDNTARNKRSPACLARNWFQTRFYILTSYTGGAKVLMDSFDLLAHSGDNLDKVEERANYSFYKIAILEQ